MWPEILKAGATALGSVLGFSGQNRTNAANARQVAQTNAFNAAEAQKNRDFQERMSDSQYQRAVADMRAAGLNPALAYQQGGAGTPGGSTASGTAARLDNPYGNAPQDVTQIVSSALEAAQAVANIDKTRAEQQNIEQDTGVKTLLQSPRVRQAIAAATSAEAGADVDSHTVNSRIAAIDKSNALVSASARDVSANATLKELGIPAAQNDSRAAQTWFGRYVAPYLDSADKVTQMVNNVVNPFKFKWENPRNQTSQTGVQYFDRKGNYTGGSLTSHSSSRH